ncbi:MAG: hypothetical protein IT379_19540 [Deltaproteobacteria bacterium]|nr:hypothetical protein [Deltaproteobacteria bacterium]
MRAHAITAVLVGVISAACSGGSGSAGGAIPIDDLPQEVAEAYCDVIFRCGGLEDELALVRPIAGTQAQCARLLRSGFENELDETLRRIAAGRVRYDGVRARACVAQVATRCGGFESEGACRGVFDGTVPLGGACESSEECAGDTYCEHEGTSDGCGVCAARAAIGASCASASCTNEVESDCSFESAEPTCVEVRYEGPVGEGSPCGTFTTGADRTVIHCATGHGCAESPSGGGTCVALPEADGPCGEDGQLCQDDQLCVAGTCRAITVQRTEGAACDREALAVCDPALRLSCEDGVCVRVGDGSEGSACAGDDLLDIGCDAGLVCVDGLCRRPAADGAPCQRDRECASDYCDDPDGDLTGTCGLEPRLCE